MEILKIEDGWIYYNGFVRRDSSTITPGFYKMKTDLSENKKIGHYKPERIDIIDGFIYYFIEYEKSFCKVSTDTNEKVSLSDEEISGMYIKDGWIYYINYNSKFLYKMTLDGTDRTEVNNRKTYQITVEEDWIYYIGYDDRASNGSYLYRIKTDGTEDTILFGSGNEEIRKYIIKDGLIYINEKKVGADEYNIWKLKVDGSEELLLKSEKYNIGTNFYVHNGWVCYQYMNHLYTIKSDGTVKKKLTGDMGSIIEVNDGWIYYLNNSQSFLIYKVRFDGTQNQIVM